MPGVRSETLSNQIQIKNVAGDILTESPYYNTLTTSQYIDTFIVAITDAIWYNMSADAAHPLNERPQMRFRVKCTNPSLRVMLKSTATEGLVPLLECHGAQ